METRQAAREHRNFRHHDGGYVSAVSFLPRPVFRCSSSIFFEASALVQFSLNSSPASRQSVCRLERCGPVIGSSFVTQSSGSFSGLSEAGGTSGGTSSVFITGRFVPAPAGGFTRRRRSKIGDGDSICLKC